MLIKYYESDRGLTKHLVSWNTHTAVWHIKVWAPSSLVGKDKQAHPTLTLPLEVFFSARHLIKIPNFSTMLEEKNGNCDYL